MRTPQRLAEDIALCRINERYFRSVGEYETAVQNQMLADTLETHGDGTRAWSSWWQRGRERLPTHCSTVDGLLGISASNGFVNYLTKDVCCEHLFLILNHLNISKIEIVGDEWWAYEKVPE